MLKRGGSSVGPGAASSEVTLGDLPGLCSMPEGEWRLTAFGFYLGQKSYK